MNNNLNRRTFLGRVTAATVGLGVLARGNAADPANAPTAGASLIVLDPAPQFELSPY